ncbi:MAG: hypothetical protein LAT63_13470 [Marinobacter sp.]|nr:hypothetical protein [Marinobacter sp.]
MISSSSIVLDANSSRQSTLFSSSQLRINQQPTAVSQSGSQLTLVREAAYQYDSSSTTALLSQARVTGQDGSQTVFTSAQLAEQTSSALLLGQQAITITRAALGSDTVAHSSQGSLSVTSNRYVFYSESESRLFSATGSVTLADGERVDFTLGLRQSSERQYQYSESLRIEERPMTDPLVINFGATSAQLTDSFFEFDLNGDGETQRLARLGSGSGYLVLDRNNNGKVDDGTELFGPRTGSGFAELARYDDDGNFWIDSKDEVFQYLKVWVQTADGRDELRTLEEVGVKALYLGNVEDRFTLASSQGVPLGQIRASGIYLTTDNQIRTLEELDLAEQVRPQAPVMMEQALGRPNPRNEPQDSASSPQLTAIRNALEKLAVIRQRQADFIEQSRMAGRALGDGSPLDDFLSAVDRLRLKLLEQQSEKGKVASQYQQIARQK